MLILLSGDGKPRSFYLIGIIQNAIPIQQPTVKKSVELVSEVTGSNI